MLDGKWRKARPVYPKDNLTLTQDIKFVRFVPSYEKEECAPNMWKLMNNEYNKVWTKEVASRNRDIYRGRIQAVQEKLIFRKHFKRCRHINEGASYKIIKLKQFQNIPGKVDTNIGRKHCTELALE